MKLRLTRALTVAASVVLAACSLVSLDGFSDGAPTNNSSPDGNADGATPRAGDEAGPESDGATPLRLDISAFGDQTCAVLDGSAYCWGSNTAGQLGDGTKTNRLTPVRVGGLPADVQRVGVGELHACAVVAGDAYCWGTGGDGQLGDGRKLGSLVPVKVAALTAGKTTSICAGTGFSCALSDGKVQCWGVNSAAQLGIGVSGASIATPALVVTGNGPLVGATEIACGQDHACALAGGEAYCWGHNDDGTLGTSKVNSNDNGLVASKVEGLSGTASVVTIAGVHACAVAGGAAYCWGAGGGGNLGNGEFTSSSVPMPVSNLPNNVSMLAAGGGPNGGDATCAVRGSDLLCWGHNEFGQLGDGSTQPRTTPVLVTNPPANLVRISVGFTHVCTIARDRSIHCWGRGTSGQLGDGAGVDRNTPVRVALP